MVRLRLKTSVFVKSAPLLSDGLIVETNKSSALFIPAGWFHCVITFEGGFLCTYSWSTPNRVHNILDFLSHEVKWVDRAETLWKSVESSIDLLPLGLSADNTTDITRALTVWVELMRILSHRSLRWNEILIEQTKRIMGTLSNTRRDYLPLLCPCGVRKTRAQMPSHVREHVYQAPRHEQQPPALRLPPPPRPVPQQRSIPQQNQQSAASIQPPAPTPQQPQSLGAIPRQRQLPVQPAVPNPPQRQSSVLPVQSSVVPAQRAAPNHPQRQSSAVLVPPAGPNPPHRQPSMVQVQPSVASILQPEPAPRDGLEQELRQAQVHAQVDAQTLAQAQAPLPPHAQAPMEDAIMMDEWIHVDEFDNRMEVIHLDQDDSEEEDDPMEEFVWPPPPPPTPPPPTHKRRTRANKRVIRSEDELDLDFDPALW